MSYQIVRFYRECPEKNRTIIKTGLTLEEAQAHCNDPETSSRTCTDPENETHTRLNGDWFDGYEEEKASRPLRGTLQLAAIIAHADRNTNSRFL